MILGFRIGRATGANHRAVLAIGVAFTLGTNVIIIGSKPLALTPMAYLLKLKNAARSPGVEGAWIECAQAAAATQFPPGAN